MQEKFESPREEVTDLRVKQMKDQTSLEFQRYKQDCRKRALELAEKSLGESRKNGTFDKGMKDDAGKVTPKEVVEESLLISLANKYYNWLISILES